MGRSLQDALLSTGLVTEDQVRGSKRSSSKRSGKPAGRRKKKRAPKSSRPAVARPKPEDAREILNAEIRALLDANRLNDESADTPFHFTRDSRVKHIYVTRAQRDRIVAGELAIAAYRRMHHVIPAAIADRIQALRPEIFVFRADGESGAGEAEDDHPVPDDLVW